TFSGAYNRVDHRDFKIEESVSKNIDLGAIYNYNSPTWKVEPFKNIAVLDSSRYYQALKDFHFNPLPDNISATANIFRQYNEQKFRQINLPPGSLGLPKLFQHDYRFDWRFTINDNLTESLNFAYTVSNNRIIRNYLKEKGNQREGIGLWDHFFDTGIPNQHNQSLQVNYELPFEKFPFLDFINAQYSYTGNFQWQKGSEILKNLPDIPDLGNTVQNSQSHQLTGTLTLDKLYQEIGIKRKGTKRN